MSASEVIILICAVVLGAVAGIFFGRSIYKTWRNKRRRMNSINQGNPFQHVEDAFNKLVREYKSNNNIQKAKLESITNNRKLAEKTVAREEEPRITRQETEKPYIANTRPAVHEEPPAKSTGIKRSSEVFDEIQLNLTIATNHRAALVPFQTTAWDSYQNGMNGIPADIRSELGQVYINMRLANNLVWMITELGDSTHELSASYDEIRSQVASSLTKISRSLEG